MSDNGDYEHWQDEDTLRNAPSAAVAGYDTHNGLRNWDYHAANQDQKDKQADAPKQPEPVQQPVTDTIAPPSAKQAPSQAPPPQQHPQQVYYMMGGYPPMQYAYPPQMQMAYPAPAYYGYPQPGLPFAAPGGAWVCQPATAPEEKDQSKTEGKTEEKKQADKPEVKKWQGRTKAEVEEDNMKIAMREGVCDARKVEPKGLKADQMVWCVEVDGSHTLRTFATVKEFHGEWKADPRFKDSWYFVRQEETKKK